MISCGGQVECVQKLQTRISELSSKVDVVQSVYEKLKAKLARCPAGLAGADCKAKVLRRFRRHITAKELVLLKQLRASARSRFRREVLSCERNLNGNPSGVASCIDKAKHALANRLGELRTRELRLNKRGAFRQCQKTADPKGCEKLVRAEFLKDSVVARDDALAAANILLSKLHTQKA